MDQALQALPWVLGVIALGAIGLFGIFRIRRETRGSTPPITREIGGSGGSLPSDRYEFIENLGSGGGGTVALVRDTVLDREVVLKRLHPGDLGGEELEKLIHEARSAASVNHPNLVTVHDVEEVNGRPVLVMEYSPGGSLADESFPLKPTEAIALMRGILAGLVCLHDEELVHRDLKPSNILLAEDGTPKIADFGVARSSSGYRLSVTGEQPGSVLYMSPEQAEGRSVDYRSDIYSATALFYEMLTGEHYLGAIPATGFAIRRAIIDQEPNLPVPELPEALNDLLQKGLSKNPPRRFDRVDEFLSELDDLRTDGDQSTQIQDQRRLD